MTVSLLENVNLLILSLHLAHLYCKSIAEWLPYVETAPICPASCGIYVSSSVQRFHGPVHMIFETLQPQKQELNFYAFPLPSNLVTSVLEAPIFNSRLNFFSPCIGLCVHRDLLLSPWNHTPIYFLFPNHISFLITTFRLIIPHFSCFGFGPFYYLVIQIVPWFSLLQLQFLFRCFLLHWDFPALTMTLHLSRTPCAFPRCRLRASAAFRSLCLHLFIPTCFLLQYTGSYSSLCLLKSAFDGLQYQCSPFHLL